MFVSALEAAWYCPHLQTVVHLWAVFKIGQGGSTPEVRAPEEAFGVRADPAGRVPVSVAPDGSLQKLLLFSTFK